MCSQNANVLNRLCVSDLRKDTVKLRKIQQKKEGWLEGLHKE